MREVRLKEKKQKGKGFITRGYDEIMGIYITIVIVRK